MLLEIIGKSCQELPYAGKIEAWPVPVAVGNVRNNSPELMEPITLR